MSIWAAEGGSHSGQPSHSQAVLFFADLSFIPIWGLGLGLGSSRRISGLRGNSCKQNTRVRKRARDHGTQSSGPVHVSQSLGERAQGQ